MARRGEPLCGAALIGVEGIYVAWSINECSGEAVSGAVVSGVVREGLGWYLVACSGSDGMVWCGEDESGIVW